MIKQFKESYPKEKQSTIDSVFSREIPKFVKSYGVNPDDVKKSPAKKFSKAPIVKSLVNGPCHFKHEKL